MTHSPGTAAKAGRRLGATAPAFAPAPLLHSIGGGGNLDEVIAFGLIIAFLVVLAAFGYRAGQQKKKRRAHRRRRRSTRH